MTHKKTFAMIFVLLLSSVVFAEVPRIMNYQGKITNPAGVALNGTDTIAFFIYDTSEAGTALWGETLSVDIVNGLFDVQLGNTHPINLDFSEPYWMELSISTDGGTTWETFSPREKLAPVSFAYRSIYADTAEYVAGEGSGDNDWDTESGAPPSLDSTIYHNGTTRLTAIPEGTTGSYSLNWNIFEVCQFGTCCPPWKDCDGDGHTYMDGTDCDEGCPDCYVGSTHITASPDGKDQDCNGSVDEGAGTSCHPPCEILSCSITRSGNYYSSEDDEYCNSQCEAAGYSGGNVYTYRNLGCCLSAGGYTSYCGINYITSCYSACGGDCGCHRIQCECWGGYQ